ncbi:MAG: hypothetical protein QI199_00475, partial [Candidatus Korarchaeota archaeon]|nr:hypothetical protein [Candidatus Korarchaeota archaeon]
MYRKLNKMEDKMRAHFSLEERIKAVNKMDALSRAISSHFIRDIVGNLRKFGQQMFRCTKCNAKYRRPPLSGKCLVCGGPIQLTVHKGTVLKYLEPTLSLMREYGIEGYLSQRIKVLEAEARSLFREEEDTGSLNTLESVLGEKTPDNELEHSRNRKEERKEGNKGRPIARKLVDFL